jgi:putative SOS response-associated peptidase YedK
MCGRAKLPNDYSEIKIKLRFDDRWPAPNLEASWNIAPTDPMLTAVLDRESGTRRPVLMKWGLIPFWSKDAKMKLPTFNAKAETVTKLPTFKNAWEAGRRCLVVTDGFYEWRKQDKQARDTGIGVGEASRKSPREELQGCFGDCGVKAAKSGRKGGGRVTCPAAHCKF